MSIIKYSELKLNRNIKGFKFPNKLNSEEAKNLIDKLSGILKESDYKFYPTKNMTSLEKLKLYEENISSGDIFKNESISGVYMKEDSDEPVIRINGSDHIEISKTAKKLNLKETYAELSNIDDILDEQLLYSFRDDFGFLTSNPNNCGNGLIAEVYLHLPATTYFGNTSLINGLNRLGYKVSTLDSERGNNLGSIYKISPERNIGIDEWDYLEKLSNVLKEIIDIEEQNRKTLYLDNIIDLEDIVNRAFGILKYCRKIEEEEMINRISDIFLGIELSILKPKKDLDLMDTINEFRNGHLQVEKGSLLDGKTRNILRANKIRKMIKEVF
ncbi:MAG: ATP--guanido phosphotransferase [Peptoniphilaceae bacterium]